jgi:hypothetical protein
MSFKDKYEAAKRQHAQRKPDTVPVEDARAISIQKQIEARAEIAEQQRQRAEEAVEAKKPERLKTGWVYFFLSTGPGRPRRVKIGWTASSVEQRRRELSTGAAYPLKLLASIPALAKLEESYWHTRFAEHRCEDAGGDEWFRLEGALLKFLKTLNSELKGMRE